MKISMIAAVGKNMELGKNNGLIWRFKEDMNFFKETTMGSAVIMGRKTFESLPKALPRRKNIVITKDTGYSPKNAFTAHDLQGALELCDGKDAFVIGGGQIYKQFLPLCDEIYLTEIEDECKDADTFFPKFDKTLYKTEKLSSCYENNIHFSHMCYTKKK